MTATTARPLVAFEIVVRNGDDVHVWLDGEGRLPRFPFPGGRDWNEAVREACLRAFGFAPESIVFAGLVDRDNRADAAEPWIGARFDVEAPKGLAPPAPWRRGPCPP
jgi:hypothetical protein